MNQFGWRQIEYMGEDGVIKESDGNVGMIVVRWEELHGV